MGPVFFRKGSPLQIILICTGICALGVECKLKLDEAEGYFVQGVSSVSKDDETTKILKGVFRNAPASTRADQVISKALAVFEIEDNRPKGHNRNIFTAIENGIKKAYDSIAGWVCNIGVKEANCDDICICKRNPIRLRPDCPPQCPILPPDRAGCAKPPNCPRNCFQVDSRRTIGIDDWDDDENLVATPEKRSSHRGYFDTHPLHSHLDLSQINGLVNKTRRRHHYEDDDDDDDGHDHRRSKRAVRGDIANPLDLRGVDIYNDLVYKLADDKKAALKDLLEVLPDEANLDFVGDVLSALDRFNDNPPQRLIRIYEKYKHAAMLNSTHHGTGRSFMAGLTAGFATNAGAAVQGAIIKEGVGVLGDALKEGVKGVVGDICGGYRRDKCDCKQQKYECKLPPVDQVCQTTFCPNRRGCPIFGCKCTNPDFQQMYGALP